MAVRRLRRKLVFTAAVVWILFLGGLALWTANPVTLNLKALKAAREFGAVVVGEVIEVSNRPARTDENQQPGPDYSVRVVDVLATSSEKVGNIEVAEGKTVPVVDFAETRPKIGERLVVVGSLHASAEALQAMARYPATPEIISAIKNTIEAR